MKKGFLKKALSCVMVSGILFASCAGLAGCSSEDSETLIAGEYTIGEDQYIIYNNTLHKGDISSDWLCKDGWRESSGSPSPTPTLKFVCGRERDTSMYVASDQLPDTDEYEKICEECFDLHLDELE